MIKIIDSRSSGKTSRLLLLAKENNFPVICQNPKRLEEKAHGYGIVGIKFYSYQNAIENGIIEEKNVLIDELELFTQTILAKNNNALCQGYSLSLE